MKRELTDLLRFFAEDEEHCIDDIGFAAAIRANNRRETLQAQICINASSLHRSTTRAVSLGLALCHIIILAKSWTAGKTSMKVASTL